MKLNKKKKGFTLIELMAVIAIVAILAAVLVPTVSGYINRSKKTAVTTQVRNAINAVETYNVTASTNDQISDATELDSLVGSTTTGSTTVKNKLEAAELLVSKDIDKLKKMTYAQAKEVNLMSDAINKITLNSDGTILSYVKSDGTTAEVKQAD